MSSGVHRLSVARTGATTGATSGAQSGAKQMRDAPAADDPAVTGRPRLEPIDTSFSFKNRAYAALKSAIVDMDVYGSRSEIRLDERSLAEPFGITRTPVSW